MPRTAAKYRAIIDPVREYFTLHGIWPKNYGFRQYMLKHHNGASKNELTKLSKGWAVLEKNTIGLVSMLRDPQWTLCSTTEALHACLSQMGIDDPASLSNHEVFDLITGKVYPKRTPPGGQVDYLMEGAWQGVELLRRQKRLIWRHSRACLSSEIPTAVGWTQVNIAYALADEQSRDDITLDQARPVAEAHMGLSTADFIDRVQAWHAWNPLLVRFAMGPRYPVGCTSVLPLTPKAYQAVRCGEQASYNCGPDDSILPSRHLLIEIVSERVATQRVEACNASVPLMASLHLQLSHLSAIHTQKRGTTINLLSFAATPLASARLGKQGFKPTGSIMPCSGVRIMERTFSTGDLQGIEAATTMWFIWLAWAVPLHVINNSS